MLGGVAVTDLNLVTVLEINATVAPSFGDKELNVQPEVAVGFLGHDVGGAVFAASRGGIVGLENRAAVNGIIDDLPFDRHRGRKAGACPVSPFVVEQRTAAIDQDFGVGRRLGAESDLGERGGEQ